MGCSVDVFTRRDSQLLPECVAWERGVRIVHVPAGPPEYLPKEELLPWMTDFTRYVTQFFRRQRKRYELVHANFWMSGLVAAELKRALDVPFVITFHALGRVRRLHQGEDDGFPDERFAVEGRIIEEADHVIAECPQDEEDLIRLYNAEPSRISIIPCGFDAAELSPISKDLARVVLGLPAEGPVLLHLGRMVPRKGIDNVIRALARLERAHGLRPRLLVVGGDASDEDPRIAAEARRLTAIAEQEGVADRVTLAGRRGREVLKYFYSAADIFLTTPWYEPFGITPVEAMACGTPVIGSNVGGIKFTVRDSETGYLVPPDDPEALAERIAHLYEHPKLLRLFGRQGVRRASDLFTWQRVADQVLDLYEVVLGRTGSEGSQYIDEQRIINGAFDDARDAAGKAHRRLRKSLGEAAKLIATSFSAGNKLLICGNGGSAADSQHFATELTGRFKEPGRPALPAIALTADSAFLTAWANDASFEDVFARQVEALGRPGDVLVAISTSGASENAARALQAASARGLQTIALLGRDGGEMRELADLPILAPGRDTQRIQELHTLLIHIICELVEARIVAASARAGANGHRTPSGQSRAGRARAGQLTGAISGGAAVRVRG
jgi:phosphoheptose isomerase